MATFKGGYSRKLSAEDKALIMSDIGRRAKANKRLRKRLAEEGREMVVPRPRVVSGGGVERNRRKH